MPLLRSILFFICVSSVLMVYGQQDMDLHLNGTFLQGKNILKVKRDFTDPYLWVLTQNNEVYRINSTTSNVDNYTGQFSAFNGLQWIDIAGVDKDHVFVASGTGIIEYKNGALNLLDSNIGIPGIVNSIGIDDSFNNNNPNASYHADWLAIATANGLIRYNFTTQSVLAVGINVPTKIFQSSYRSQMFHDGSLGRNEQDIVSHYSMSEHADYTLYRDEVWLGDEYGANLRCAFFTRGNMWYNYSAFSIFANIFWATENGLFQIKYGSVISAQPHHQYLSGNHINTISSIYGLSSFTNALSLGGPADNGRENLLVGTDEGLYFSNSNYLKIGNGQVNQYSFYHYDELGVKKINDICVNANSYDITDRYITQPCEDGIWVAANDGLYFLRPDYVPYINANRLQAIQFDGQAFNVSEVQLCAAESTKANISSSAYSGNLVQWYKDGQQLSGEINASLIINQDGDYNAVLYDPCTGVHFETNHLKVTLVSAPVFTFNYPNQLNYCEGATATLQTENNTNYQYRWYKNGVLNGNTTPVLNTTQSGKYKLEVSACAGNWISTPEVTVNFVSMPQATIIADKPAYCIGDQATLSINIPTDNSYTINWMCNGSIITPDENKTSITTAQAGVYTVDISSSLVTCSQLSNVYNLSFENIPTLNLERIVNTTLCSGQSVDLKADYSGGNIRWSTGATTNQISIMQSGTYTATVSTAGGCEITKDISLTFMPNPILNMPDATLCQFTNDQLTLTAPAGFAKYEWNGTPGGQTFVTNRLGAVSLTVTDQNGCNASQTINISSQCRDIHIPNTFTPNGDGINDKWVITGIEGDPGITVKVYNRLGNVIFHSQGYPTPWDGLYNNKKIQAGVYYYVINAKSSNQVLSGSLTIIY